MKRLLMTTVAGLMIAGAFSLPAVAQQGRGGFPSHQGATSDRGAPPPLNTPSQAQNGQRDHGATPGRSGDRNPGNQNAGQNWGQQRGGDHDRNFADNRRPDPRYSNRNDHRYDNNRFAQRWDRHDWRRGERLGDYNRRYSEVSYRDYRLDRPPSGYRWVRADNGDFLLAALAGGLIAAIIANN